MSKDIQNIKFDFELHGRGDDGYYGIAAYFNNDIQLYELIDEDGTLITNYSRKLNMSEREIKNLQEFYGYNEQEVKIIIEQFDTQARDFLSKNKFLQKPNLIIRYKKKDVLHRVELEIINEKKQTGEYVRELISNGYNYEYQNGLVKETISMRTPYLIMSYEETICRNDYDHWLFTLTGKTYFTLFNFIVKRPDRWEYQDGNLYIPVYKFLEQVGLYKVSFHLETGINEDTSFDERDKLECKKEFKNHLLDKQVISLKEFNFSHPYMSNVNKSNEEFICLDLTKFKELISKQLDTLSYMDEYAENTFKFNFISEAKVRGYSDKIPAFFLDEESLNKFIENNSQLYL